MNTFPGDNRRGQRIEPIWRYEDARAFSEPQPAAVSGAWPNGERSGHELVRIGVAPVRERGYSAAPGRTGIIVLRAGEQHPGSF